MVSSWKVNKGYFLVKKLGRKIVLGMCYLETKGNLITKTSSWSATCIFLVHFDWQKKDNNGAYMSKIQ